MSKHIIKPYIDLIEYYIKAKISANEFEQEYIDLYLNDSTAWPEELFQILNKLFSDVDSFCHDETLLETLQKEKMPVLNEPALQQCAEEALLKLREYAKAHPNNVLV
jgi:hypothetical protein